MSAEIKAKLLEAGSEEGCISIDMLNDLIPEDNDPDTIDEIFDFLHNHNIEILSQEQLKAQGKDEILERDRKKRAAAAQEATEKETKAAQENESGDVEETTTTYLREMGQFELLTPEEEEKYSKAIRNGFNAIINAVRTDPSGITEIRELATRIDLWEKRDPTLKPKKTHLNHLLRSVEKARAAHPDVQELNDLAPRTDLHPRPIKPAKHVIPQATRPTSLIPPRRRRAGRAPGGARCLP